MFSVRCVLVECGVGCEWCCQPVNFDAGLAVLSGLWSVASLLTTCDTRMETCFFDDSIEMCFLSHLFISLKSFFLYIFNTYAPLYN